MHGRESSENGCDREALIHVAVVDTDMDRESVTRESMALEVGKSVDKMISISKIERR